MVVSVQEHFVYQESLFSPQILENGASCFFLILFAGLETPEKASFQPPTPEKCGSFSSSVSDRAKIPQFVALGELEFRKAFLILSYIGGYAISFLYLFLIIVFVYITLCFKY